MSSSWYRTIATVIATGMSGMANRTAIGVPATRPQGTMANMTTIIASSNHSSWRRVASFPRR